MNARAVKQGSRTELEWRDGITPVSKRFDDPYYTLSNGLAEARHVFLRGNGLPERFRPGFHIAELGFGTGLNALAALYCWKEAGVSGPLAFTSFEAFPLSMEEMARALVPFPELGELALPLLEAWGVGETRISTSDLELTVITGDARETLPQWDGKAEAWFLDGFSPAKNPELWEEGLLDEVAQHTSPGGTLATYSAAGHVREKLTQAGFEITRAPGYGTKRHMTRGVLRP